MSFHYINQVISIAKDWKSIEWRLGGIRPTIPLTPDQQFSGQHTAMEIAPGRIVLFDNGRDRGGYSRAMELALDNGKATTSWQWRPEKDNYSSAISSARRLPNGNTLVVRHERRPVGLHGTDRSLRSDQRRSTCLAPGGQRHDDDVSR